MRKFTSLAILCCSFGTATVADPFEVHSTAQRLFDDLPSVEVPPNFGEICGMGRNSNPHIGFCTSNNVIYVSADFAVRDLAGYEMAHVLGHAIQVRHGIADIAFREIRLRPDEEDALRGMVTRQVECVAGVLMARAGRPAVDLLSLGREPFTDAHWGRAPLNGGPKVSIGLDARAEWYAIGYAARDFAACSVGEVSADLILQAER